MIHYPISEVKSDQVTKFKDLVSSYKTGETTRLQGNIDHLRKRYQLTITLLSLYGLYSIPIHQQYISTLASIQQLIDQINPMLINSDLQKKVMEKAFFPFDALRMFNNPSGQQLWLTFAQAIDPGKQSVENDLVMVLAFKDLLSLFFATSSSATPRHNTLGPATVLPSYNPGYRPLASPLDTHIAVDKQLQQVIEHYYLNPDHGQIQNIIDGNRYYDPSSSWREHHGVDHVVRTTIILEAAIQLHQQFSEQYSTLFQKYEMLDRMLPLAMVYHDIAAEIAPKEDEEKLAAEALERDLQGVGIPEMTVELVVSALKNKNVDVMDPVTPEYLRDQRASPDERLVRRLLRLPDSVDIARVKIVSPEASFVFPGQSTTTDDNLYTIARIDLDPDLVNNPEFYGKLDSLDQDRCFLGRIDRSFTEAPDNSRSCSSDAL